MITNWLSPHILEKEKIKEMQNAFRANPPFPHLFISKFIQEEKAKKLLASLKKEPFEKKQSDLFSLSQTQDFATTSQAILQEFYELFQSKEFTKMISIITGIKLKGKIIDMAGSLYEDTDFLLCHDDQLQGRKIAYIYYLSEDFTEKDGGALALLDENKGNPSKVIQRYLHVWNSMVIFKVSPQSWHEVEEVLSTKKRYAIEGWLY